MTTEDPAAIGGCDRIEVKETMARELPLVQRLWADGNVLGGVRRAGKIAIRRIKGRG